MMLANNKMMRKNYDREYRNINLKNIDHTIHKDFGLMWSKYEPNQSIIEGWIS